MAEITSHSLEETQKLARDLLMGWQNKWSSQDQATIIGLEGDLGSGKTTFTQFVARELGVKEVVTSPTFVLMKFYELGTKNWPWKKLVHIDCYRLNSATDLEKLGIKEIIADAKNLILVEWPECVRPLLATAVKIGFKFINETDRQITFYDQEK